MDLLDVLSDLGVWSGIAGREERLLPSIGDSALVWGFELLRSHWLQVPIFLDFPLGYIEILIDQDSLSGICISSTVLGFFGSLHY